MPISGKVQDIIIIIADLHLPIFCEIKNGGCIMYCGFYAQTKIIIAFKGASADLMKFLLRVFDMP